MVSYCIHQVKQNPLQTLITVYIKDKNLSHLSCFFIDHILCFDVLLQIEADTEITQHLLCQWLQKKDIC